MAITASGIGSGIDIHGLVEQLVAAQRQRPEQLLDNREANLNGQISAIGDLKSALSTFQDSLDKLSSQSAFQVYGGSSSNEAVATITTEPTAQQGSFNIVVSQLATAHKSISTGFADATTVEVGTGSITIANSNPEDADFSLSFSSGTNTLNDIRDAINNADDNFGVTATILNVDDGIGGTESKLVITADETGTANGVTLTADAGISSLDSGNLTEIGTLQDAQLTIDGQAVTSATNVITSAISGVNLNLVAAGSATITVDTDVDAVTDNVQEFVDSYNSLKEKFNELASYNGGNPGALYGDSTIRGLISQVNSVIYSSVDSITGDYNSLATLGITSNRDTGLFSFDSENLSNLLQTDFDVVANLFTATDGIASSLSVQIESYNQFSGLLDSKKDSLNTRLGLIDDSRERMDYRLGKLEDRLTSQFIAMDALVQGLNSTGTFLTQQLANLPGFTREK